ncbi:hypothetical protein [Pseudomarimonas arenosa]|uniref:DNA ligase (ATP) n=1 Tax=Pseudomarimonas arenosa TaxID=2774145 RepID=A0AAW3ZJQ9_9GAMM|nr:hypothetical protein [Pseudomarimonas arenosa]MBD8525257.1 hypothetical protein [Pseudomarimonas arenosa]
MFNQSKLSWRGDYGIATGGAVTDHVLLNVANEFDQQVMRKIQALSPADLPQRFSGDDPVLVAHKYDGEGVFVYFERGKTSFAFSAPGGRVRVGFPALKELEAKLIEAGVNKALLRCELALAEPGSERRGGVSEVIRLSFSASDDDLARLKLVALDAVMLDGRDLRAQQSAFTETWDLLERLVGADASARVHRMEAKQLPEKDVAAEFARIVETGGEGVVVRRLNRADAFKIKPHRSIDAVVIGFVEGEFEGQWGVASLLTGLSYPEEGTEALLQTFVRVGSGLKDAQRVALLDTLRPLKLAAPLPMTDSSGRTVQFVRPTLIAELHGEDLIQAEGGQEQRTQVLSWNSETKSYEFLGLAPCARLSFARFARLREDKEWQSGGARIAQIGSDASRPQLHRSSGEAKVLRREVYGKGEMLRKLVVLHKDDADLAFPYLIYWTDYSARRAEPLKVSLDVAINEERAQVLAEQRLQQGLTKGFVRLL